MICLQDFRRLTLYNITRMSTDDTREKGELAVQTPEQILKQAVLDTKNLDKESQKALRLKDEEGVRNKLKQRAGIVAQLPERVAQAESLTGLKVPEDEMETLRFLQHFAQKALERGNAYELGLVLTGMRGAKTGKLNLLDQLVNRLYPQKPK